MNVVRRERMTLEQFLAWEERQELRYEFDGERPIAMTGGTEAHSVIQVNLVSALKNSLAGTRCRAHGSHMKVMLAGKIRYPDAFVVCSPLDPGRKVIADPVVVFEILSDGSVAEDLVVKNAEYRAAASVQRYVVLQQTRAAATVFSRAGDLWVTEVVDGTAAVLSMPEVGIEVSMSEIYDGMVFEAREDVDN